MNLPLFLTRIDKLAQLVKSKGLLLVLLRYRVLAGGEHRHALGKNLATVVDIGASRGQFSLAVRHWSPKAKVIAFEPLKEPAERFCKIFQKDPMIKFHQAAIGPESGDATIHVSAADDSSSLLPIAALQKQLFPGTAETRTEMIKVGRLADFVSPEEIAEPALLKLDVQGFELEAMKGCEDLLEYFRYVYAECSFVELYTGQALAHEIISWLNERSFRLKGIYNMTSGYKVKSIQGDFLFEMSYC